MEVVKVPLPISPKKATTITRIYPFIIDQMKQLVVENTS